MTGTGFVQGGIENHAAQKKAIKQYGGIVASVAGTSAYNDAAGSRKPIVSWYLPANPGSGHFVTLVGWDDNYKYTIFLEQINTDGTLPNSASLPSFQIINEWGQERIYAAIQTPIESDTNGHWRSIP